jgi:hypothetical protein
MRERIGDAARDATPIGAPRSVRSNLAPGYGAGGDWLSSPRMRQTRQSPRDDAGRADECKCRRFATVEIADVYRCVYEDQRWFDATYGDLRNLGDQETVTQLARR